MSDNISDVARILGQSLFASDNSRNITDALLEIASALRMLGTGDAATEMGATEYLATQIADGATELAVALNGVAEAISDHG